jgi:enoyl-CoA hydratase
LSDYDLTDGTATITFDDGKVNALGSALISDVHACLDQSIDDSATAIILSGRAGVFSAGFDLNELRSSADARESLRRNFVDLVLRIFTLERPVVIACTGHAMAAGAALLLAADRRIGLDGPFKLGFNEATLGVSISPATVALARYRMPMPWFESIISGDTFTPSRATIAGLLDSHVSGTSDLMEQSRAVAESLSRIPRETFTEMRGLARGATIETMQQERRLL